MPRSPKTVERTEAELNELIYPVTPGNGNPIKLGDLLAFLETMNDKSLPLHERTAAAARLLPFYHDLVPEKTLAWASNIPKSYARP